MSSHILLNQLRQICSELRSEKLTFRNKAVGELDNLLSNSKNDLINLYGRTSERIDPSWANIFSSMVDASLMHAEKVQEAQGSKVIQTLRNKNHIYSSIMNKLIDYSLEDNHNFLMKSTVLTAFFNGFSNRVVVKNFGKLFLQVLERGVYESVENTADLKVNELSRILSFLFEVNIPNDESFKLAVMRCINKTLELSQQHVQLGFDFKDYFDEVNTFASDAHDDHQKAEVIKMFYLFTYELSVDYHISVCGHIQQTLPILCGFYNFRMKPESKTFLFRSSYCSLKAIYPNITNGDYNPIGVSLNENWLKSIPKLMAIVNVEAKEQTIQLQGPTNTKNDVCLKIFVKMAAIIVYLVNWGTSDSSLDGAEESRSKISRNSDQLEVILASIMKDNSSINQIWIEIFTELIVTQRHLINLSNYSIILKSYQRSLQFFNCWQNLKCIRLGIVTLLKLEQDLFATMQIETNRWSKIVEFLIADTSSNSDVLREKHLLLQELIRANKLCVDDCIKLLNFFLVNSSMRRNECITTTREIMRYNENCNVDKTSNLIGKLLNWLYESSYRVLLLNIDPLNEELVADTSSLMVINFLDSFSHEEEEEEPGRSDAEDKSNLLSYKYCRKYICIDEHGKEMRKANEAKLGRKSARCIIQSNYELLMRLLHFESSKEANMSNINADLSRQLKMILLLRKFFDYNIFDESSCMACPLVKRIGFFFDNVNFQLKSIIVQQTSKSELLEATDMLLKIFSNICSCEIFLNLLSKQNIEGIIDFAGSALRLSETNNSDESKELSLITFKLLATLCSSSTHSQRAFIHMKQQRLSIRDNIAGILMVTKIFCLQQQNPEIASWIVEKLKTICQLYHTNVTISEQIVDMISEIVRYVEPFPDELQVVFVVISSFLKIAFKKSYSTQFGAKLIKSIRRIVKYCPNIFVLEDFVTICLSSVKFLASPSIAISFAVVNIVTSLMDSKWFSIHSANMEKHFNFCCTLYSHLNWKTLPMDSDDVKQNSTAVSIQLLTSLFAFSSFHREVAFEELANYYSAQSLSESNFYQFGQIAAYYNCSLSAFTKPYADALLYTWTEKQHPIARFPYFLCAENREKYFIAHLPNICYYQLRFSPNDGLEELQSLKYGQKRHLITKALPVCYAYSLSLLSGNTQHPSVIYATEANSLVRNLKDLGCDLVANNISKLYWTTLYNATKQLWDECHFAAIFGFNLYAKTPRLSVNFLSMKHILRFYLRKCYQSSDNLTECIHMLLKSDPMILLKVFTAFKLESSEYIFIGDKLKSFYWYCALAEIVIDSVAEQFPVTGLDSTKTFFLRDILFFILNSMESENVEQEILSAGLYFIHHVLDKYISAFSEIINKHLNEIAYALVAITQNCKPSNVQDMGINLLEMIICQHTKDFYESIKLLDQFPDADIYQNVRTVQRNINESKETDIRWAVQHFLNAHTKGSVGLMSLKQCIADKKCDFQDLSIEGAETKHLLYNLLKRLIDIVRGNDLNLAMDAAKCLGEIGPVKIGDISFYFECDTTFYNMESAYRDEMEFFSESFYRLLDKLLLKYDPVSCTEMYAVCIDLANSKVGSKVLASFPSMSVFLKSKQTSVLDMNSTVASFSFIDILRQHENLGYNEWVKAFSSSVFKQCQWESFAELCKLNFSFSESSIVPVFKFLLANKETHFNNIVAMLDEFFLRTFEAIQNEEWKISKNIFSDKRIIKYFLGICECIRIHNNWNVPVNILYVAKACIYCQAYFMGILYIEMWALEERDKPSSKHSDIIRNPIFQDLATQAFKSIDCAEAISGLLDPLTSRLEYLNLEGDWSQVLLEIDASNDLNKTLYVQNLKKNGLLMLSSSEKLSNKLDYECCWRLGQWDTAVESNSNIGSLNDLEYEYEKNHFNALKSLHNKEEVNCVSAIDRARRAIISILKEISIECLQSIYKYLTWLHLLQQAEEFCQIQFVVGPNTEEILAKWNLEHNLKYGNFSCTELVLSHQMTLYKTAGIRAGRKINEFFKDKSPIGECILSCINECKNAGNINLAIRNVALLRNIDTSPQLKAKALLEDAEICWKAGKTRMSQDILHNVMSNKDFVYCIERIQAYRMYGELLLETKNESFDEVHAEFFLRSIELLNKYSECRDRILKSNALDASEFETFDRESRKQAFATIAKHADNEYMQLNTYLNSDTFHTKEQIMKKNKAEAQNLATQSKDREKSIGINVMLRNCGIDDKEIKMLKLKRSDNLCIAMKNYIQFCKLDDAVTSPAVYRIIALWFANKHDETLHNKIKDILHEIPSFKFLCVLNQMSARLSSKNIPFLKLLEAILIKCIEDHPHHTLHKILALEFAYADDPKNNSTSDRVTIAKNIITKATNKSNSTCIKQMKSMFSALIDFANKDAGKNASLLLSEKLRKLKNLDNVQCPTMDLPIAINKEYSLSYVRKWEENVGLVGGINAPKKLMCVCSDGVTRPQLLKGKDDLRQDAVMQQVLSMVNELLKSDPETNDQKLVLRTYKVVPLSMRSGILEWCNNTVPLGLYLCGDKKTEGAHKKYRPKDYTVAKCRTISLDAMKKQDFKHRLETYMHICEKIKPVFHYFFFEKFLVPGIWFERRLAYTKSVATTSIVGFILGLGDRHVQNILIDELTAEVIHIDFGIAFEQGKIMPTPETVPFRLTRDIVAPMGISKTDGVFRKVCEKTMKIMRKNHVFLTTILEVLLYDPLYVWKWSSQKTLDGDKDGHSEEKNLTAQRALFRVQDKLEGKEEGKMGTHVVEAQIQRLINEAINAHNLCRLYPGWDPYL